jgi:WD40 repeat protein
MVYANTCRFLTGLAGLCVSWQAHFVSEGVCADEVGKSSKVSFSASIAPILQSQCVACHSARKSEGGYRVDTYHDLMLPGDSANSPVVAKKVDSSALMQRLTAHDPAERMPPESDPLPPENIEAIKNWIEAGAEFDGKDPRQLLSLVVPVARFAAPPKSYPAVPLISVAFSVDGKLVFCSGYHEITVWDAADQCLVRRISNIGQRVFKIAVSPDGNMLAVACGEPGRGGEVRLINVESGEVEGVVARCSDVALDVEFRPNREEIAVALADHSIRIVNYKTLETVRSYSSHADWVTAIAFSNDGNLLASASRDKTAKVFDIESAKMLINYAGHGVPVRGVVFSEDGKQVFSAGDDKKLHRWNVADAKKTADISLDGEGNRLVRGNGTIFVPTGAKRIAKIDLATNKVVHLFTGHNDWVISAAVSADGSVVGGGMDGEARIWNTDGSLRGVWKSGFTETSK